MSFNDTRSTHEAICKAVQAGATCYYELVISGAAFSYTFIKDDQPLSLEAAQAVNSSIISECGDMLLEVANYNRDMKSFTLVNRLNPMSNIDRPCTDGTKDYTSKLIPIDVEYYKSLLAPVAQPVDSFNTCK